MKNTAVTIGYDEEKLTATRIYMEQKELSVEQELTKAMEGLYGKYVPANVREFLELRYQTAKPVKKKPMNPGETAEAQA